jgi:hypothetical protein
MSIQEVSAEQLAELFHHYHHALAPDSDSLPLDDRHQSWNDVPIEERNRMTAAARLALLELESLDSGREKRRRYFAKPGEAEWGC